MKMHQLKSWKWVYEAVIQQEKTFEVRKNDRDFQKGDCVIFWEVTQEGLETGVKSKPFIIDYVLTDTQFPQGIQPGYCVFSITPHQWYAADMEV